MKKNIKYLLICACLCMCTYVQVDAQKVGKDSPQQAIFIEILGQGGLATFNYDRRFTKSSDGPGFRVGAGYMNVGKFEGYTIPVSLNYLLGNDGKYFELGMGLTHCLDS